MPKLPTRTTHSPEIAAALQAWKDFESPGDWDPSKRKPSNLWRHWEGMTLTIFRRSDGFYGWCIADADGSRFSNTAFEMRGDAMTALGEELGVGGI